MSPEFFWCIIALFALAGLGAPIALAMIAASILYLLAKGQDPGLAAEQMIQGIYDGFLLLAIPLFIIAANVMNAGTISERLLHFCLALVGRFRGGLGHVNVVANMIFAGMSGSAVADAVGLGKIIIGMMTREGRYSPGYAAAITAAASTIGPIIPPSIPMVMYALVSDTSIGYLFLGGFIPGVMMGLALMVLNARQARRENVPLEVPVPRAELPRLTIRAFPALMMPVILLFGIYGGATTPTEAAAIAAFYALLVATFLYRAVSFPTLYTVFSESARATASVGLVIGASLIFNYIVAAENIPAAVSNLMQGLNVSPLAFLIGINILFLVLGCLLDATTIILVIIPLFIPTCRALGIDLVHFGVTAVVNCMIGLITPPYGVLLFVINA
ncbi:MAG: TRAP transporter large permease, partial [Hyphomicrobiales bacterium]|nr:TRAP transporter large permease [Hyphomicrobiales bacterium]